MSITTETSNIQQPIDKAAHVAASLAAPLRNIAANSSDQAEYYSAAFKLIARAAHAKWGEVNFEQRGQMLSRTYISDKNLNPEVLLDLTTTLAVESQVINRTKSRLIEVGDKTFCLTTCPFSDEKGQSVGSATVFAQIASQNVLPELEKFLTACVEVMRMCGEQSQTTTEPEVKKPDTKADAQLTALGKAAKFSDVRELCFALTNNFCQKYGCQRSAIGLVQNNHIKIQSISGMDNFVDNSPVVVDMRQAMEECYDHGERIVVQHRSEGVGVESDQFFLNKRLHEQTGGSAVCSVPIRSEGEIVGVLNLQRDLAHPFTANELQSFEQSLDAYGPAFEMLRKSSMTISSQIKTKVRETVQSTFFGAGKRKYAALALLAAAIWFVIGPMPFSPKIPCTVQSQSSQQIAAPFDGVIKSAPLAAGDEVKAGQVILTFDTKDLTFERQSISAKMKSFAVARDNALQAGKTSEAAIAAAEINVLSAQLDGVKKRIENASVIAPFNGTIIRGDLRQQIGQPVAVGSPLFEIASSDQMRIELAIPESTASYIKPGQKCQFVLASHPGSRMACEIERVTPSTVSVDGRNVVMARALIDGDEEWLQSGMEGVAKVKTGWQPVWWVTTRSMLDRLRLGFWL